MSDASETPNRPPTPYERRVQVFKAAAEEQAAKRAEAERLMNQRFEEAFFRPTPTIPRRIPIPPRSERPDA